MDPRHWDLLQLVSAYEVTLQQGAKDESAWRRMRAQLYAEPAEVKKGRAASRQSGATGSTPRGAMTLSGVEALLSGVAARDAQYGVA